MLLKNTPEKLIFGRRATKGGKFSTAKSDVKLANRDTVQQESLIGAQRVERDPDEVCMADIDLYMHGGYRGYRDGPVLLLTTQYAVHPTAATTRMLPLGSGEGRLYRSTTGQCGAVCRAAFHQNAAHFSQTGKGTVTNAPVLHERKVT